jgi:hypothetical protein
VIDAAPVDGRRRLVLIRRDNVEHLLMIGGPSDVVVEANIVRAAAAQRDMPVPRAPAAADTLPRPVPLADGTMWPLQPEPSPSRPARAVEEAQWTAEPEAAAPPPPAPPVEVPARRSEPMARLQRSQDTALAGLGHEPMGRPSPDIGAIRPSSPIVERAPERPAERSAATDRPVPVQRPPTAERIGRGPERASLAERVAERMPVSERPPAVERPPVSPIPAAGPRAEVAPVDLAPAEPLPPGADENLTEMAQRLEAALRRPVAAEPRADTRTRPPGEAAPAAAAEVAPPAAEPRPKPKTLYDSLEQEMASLLGRPAGKP